MRAAFRAGWRYDAAVASELAAPLLRAAGRAVAGAPRHPVEWRRGLILSHAHIGDVLYRTPSLPRLTESLPGCVWTFLTSNSGAEVLAHNPHVHPLAGMRGDHSWQLRKGAFTELQRLRFDVALCTNAIAYYADLVLATALRIPARVSFPHKGVSGLATHHAPISFPSPFPAYVREMVAWLTGTPPDWELRPRMYPRPEDIARAAEERQRLQLGSRPIVACAPLARQTGGRTPVEFFLQSLAAVQADHDLVLCGSATEGEHLRQLARALGPHAHVVAGTLTLHEFTAFLSQCTVLLSQDSGPRHMANAAGIPVLFARNAAVNAIETGRYCEGEVDLADEAQLDGTPDPARAAALIDERLRR